ncbi:MAG: hypothetical protein QGI08_01395 [Paracoccaceae bacterium]|nr:hypothetical protein [Paracoccaceae bacterium]MDP7184358.1 hypothetical protein [Paracoccaceae bacterium]
MSTDQIVAKNFQSRRIGVNYSFINSDDHCWKRDGFNYGGEIFAHIRSTLKIGASTGRQPIWFGQNDLRNVPTGMTSSNGRKSGSPPQ